MQVVNMTDRPELKIELSSISVDNFKAAMRNLAAGVSIITTGKGEQRRGLTATAVCSLSADPPSIMICVNRSSETSSVIKNAGFFAVNFLAFEQLDLALRFAGSDGHSGEDKFGKGTWTELSTGAPILARCLCAVDCELINRIEHGSHSIYIGRIVDTFRRVEGEPLLYFRGQFSQVDDSDLLDFYIESGFEA